MIRPPIDQPASDEEIAIPPASRKTQWRLDKLAFSLLPLGPGARRKTLQEEVVRGSVYTHDQIQGIVVRFSGESQTA